MYNMKKTLSPTLRQYRSQDGPREAQDRLQESPGVSPRADCLIAKVDGPGKVDLLQIF